MNTLMFAILSIVLSVAAQFSLKMGMSSTDIKEILTQPFALRSAFIVLSNKYVFSGFFLYGLGAAVWLEVLSKWDVSKAYPLVGLGFIFTVAIGQMTGEHITSTRLVGVMLISIGVLLVGRT